MLELHVLAHPALWFVKTSWPSSIHTIQKAVCPVLHIPKLHGLLGDSPFSVCSGHGNCQIQENREPDTRSQLGLPFPERTTAKESILSYTVREQQAKMGTPKRCRRSEHVRWWRTWADAKVPPTQSPQCHLHWLWPSSTMTTVTTQKCRVWLPSDSHPFWYRKGRRCDKIHTDITRGSIKLSHTSGFQAAVLRIWGFPWITADIHERWLIRGSLLSGGLSDGKFWVTHVEGVDD